MPCNPELISRKLIVEGSYKPPKRPSEYPGPKVSPHQICQLILQREPKRQVEFPCHQQSLRDGFFGEGDAYDAGYTLCIL